MFQHTSVREAINSNDEGVHSTPSKCIDMVAELDKDDENHMRLHFSGSKRKSMMADDDMSDDEVHSQALRRALLSRHPLCSRNQQRGQ